MKYETYDNIKAKSRIQELELIAFANMTGEDVIETLKVVDEKLAKEYDKLGYEDSQ